MDDVRGSFGVGSVRRDPLFDAQRFRVLGWGLLPCRASAALETSNRLRQGASRRSWLATIKTCNAA